VNVPINREVYEYQRHFNHLKLAVFDERLAIHGSTNLNFRSLEDDKDFELVVLTEGQQFASHNLRDVRDLDLRHARRITEREVHGRTLAERCASEFGTPGRSCSRRAGCYDQSGRGPSLGDPPGRGTPCASCCGMLMASWRAVAFRPLHTKLPRKIGARSRAGVVMATC
jgi:phosphatidylserine/phosphatidylglycerophosphate/cardiolipin synthase-like enzyme